MLLPSVLCSLFLWPILLKAQANNNSKINLRGSINLEDTSGKPAKSYSDIEKIITLFTKAALSSAQKYVQDGSVVSSSSAELKVLEDDELDFYAASAVFCGSKLGPCVFLFEALLVRELLTARDGSDYSCPMLSSFWKRWVDNDMEKRQQFMTRMADINRFEQFKRTGRKPLIKCRETVEEFTKLTPEERKKRVEELLPNLKKAAQFFQELTGELGDKKVENVFSEIGIVNLKDLKGKKS